MCSMSTTGRWARWRSALSDAFMRTPVNRFKRALTSEKVQAGLWLGLTDSVCIEIAAGAGYDWLLLDGEHAPFDVAKLLVGLQVAAGFAVQPLVRLPEGNPVLIKKVLDLGAQTILVPTVESAAQARRLVSAIRYPPRGFRGVGTGLARAAFWNQRSDYLERADDEICLVVQIETARGLDCLEEILSVEGIDALFIGPADLAASLGHLGKPGHPDVQRAIFAAMQRIRACGKSCGSLVGDPVLARKYVEAGCNFIGVGLDTVLFRGALQRALSEFRNGADNQSSKESSGEGC